MPIGRRLALASAAAMLAGPGARGQDQAGSVTIGEGLDGYRARPGGDGPVPCVLVASGDAAQAAEICRRLAGSGHLAVAPSLSGDVLPALDRAAAWAEQEGAAPGRLVIAGFGTGSAAAWLYATRSDRLKAAVAWGSPAVAGSLPDLATQLRTPMLGLYGGRDPAHPQSMLLQVEAKARQAGRVAEIVVYRDAETAYASGTREQDAMAADAWGRMLAWFTTHGG